MTVACSHVQGFVDAHLHLIPGGLSLKYVNLRNARSQQEFASIVKAAADKLQPGQWILGGQWDDNVWGGGLPDVTWIDEVRHPPQTQVFLGGPGDDQFTIAAGSRLWIS